MHVIPALECNGSWYNIISIQWTIVLIKLLWKKKINSSILIYKKKKPIKTGRLEEWHSTNQNINKIRLMNY